MRPNQFSHGNPAPTLAPANTGARQQGMDGHTAMHLAARFGQENCVKVLAKKLPDLVKAPPDISRLGILRESEFEGGESLNRDMYMEYRVYV